VSAPGGPLRCLELFAGAGGAALGLAWAGVEHVALIERDPAACATLRAAGLGLVIEGDAEDVAGRMKDWRAALEPAAWDRAGDDLLDSEIGGEDDDPDAWPLAREALASRMVAEEQRVDLLWSSPPCPLHSRANSRRRAEAFDGWPTTLAWVDALRPEWVAVENVQAALDVARDVWTAALTRRGYSVVSAILDAADYGVPQWRRRVVLLAHRGGPVFLPEPTHGFCRAPHRTLAEAVPLLLAEDDPHLRYTEGRAASERWRLGVPAPTVMTTEVKGTRASAASGWTFHGGPDRASDAAYLAVGRRRLTWQECAALQGFPEHHPWHGTAEERYRQVGNAVPPQLAEAIGRALVSAA
jgi:DNA (cytosine-5)-methyltransferase 1